MYPTVYISFYYWSPSHNPRLHGGFLSPSFLLEFNIIHHLETISFVDNPNYNKKFCCIQLSFTLQDTKAPPTRNSFSIEQRHCRLLSDKIGLCQLSILVPLSLEMISILLFILRPMSVCYRQIDTIFDLKSLRSLVRSKQTVSGDICRYIQ